MKVTETLNEGLRRELKVAVPKEDMAGKMEARLEELRSTAQLKGFRRGKVPIGHLRRVHGRRIMAEIVNETIGSRIAELLEERNETPLQRPEIDMTEDEDEAEGILSGKADFEFTVSYELTPEFDSPDLESIEVERPVAKIEESRIDEELNRIAESVRPYSERKGKAKPGDRLSIDYSGSMDGESFPGSSDRDALIVLGSGSFLPGFEEALVGVSPGEEKTVSVTFPESYPSPELAGKRAEFEVSVKKVESPGDLLSGDDLARNLGLEDSSRLREAVRGRIESRYGALTREKVKSRILDGIDERLKMELPTMMVEREFEAMWEGAKEESPQEGEGSESSGKEGDSDSALSAEEEARKEECRSRAERRVRLGLALDRIGKDAGIEVTERDLQQAMAAHASRYPGMERQMMNHWREHPESIAALRAPIFEEKVIDYIMSRAKISDREMSVEELTAEGD